MKHLGWILGIAGASIAVGGVAYAMTGGGSTPAASGGGSGSGGGSSSTTSPGTSTSAGNATSGGGGGDGTKAKSGGGGSPSSASTPASTFTPLGPHDTRTIAKAPLSVALTDGTLASVTLSVSGASAPTTLNLTGGGSNMTIQSNNTSVATVSGMTVTAVAPGTAYIVALWFDVGLTAHNAQIPVTVVA